MFKKSFFIGFLAIFFWIGSSWAITGPQINFDRTLTKSVGQPSPVNPNPVPYVWKSNTERRLGDGPEHFEETSSEGQKYYKKLNLKGYEGYTVYYDQFKIGPQVETWYILQNNRVVGYVLIDYVFFDVDEQNPSIPLIKALPLNTKYLDKKIKVHPGATFEIHEARHADFIELYGIYKSPGRQVLLMDAFYPKVFDSYFQQHIFPALNFNILFYGKYDGLVKKDD